MSRKRKYLSDEDARLARNLARRNKYAKSGISEYRREYYRKYMKSYNKKYRSENPDKFSGYRKSDIFKAKRRRYYLKNIKNPNFKLRLSIGKAVWKSLRTGNGSGKLTSLLNYSINELRIHLESLFKAGMSWSNYGEWHIDHVRPVSSFNITSCHCVDFKECWSLKNLQPLWKEENIAKSNKWHE